MRDLIEAVEHLFEADETDYLNGGLTAIKVPGYEAQFTKFIGIDEDGFGVYELQLNVNDVEIQTNISVPATRHTDTSPPEGKWSEETTGVGMSGLVYYISDEQGHYMRFDGNMYIDYDDSTHPISEFEGVGSSVEDCAKDLFSSMESYAYEKTQEAMGDSAYPDPNYYEDD